MASIGSNFDVMDVAENSRSKLMPDGSITYSPL
jgi:hypothetical protein